MKKALFSLLLLLAVSAGRAQENPAPEASDTLSVESSPETKTAMVHRPLRHLEFEIALGIIGKFDHLIYETGAIGPTLNLEMRWNFNRLPLDLGIQAYLGQQSHSYHASDGSMETEPFTSIGCLGVVDYNFRREKKVSFFVGAGVGTMWCNYGAPFYFGYLSYLDDLQLFSMMCRAGVEFWHHLRITAYYRQQNAAHRHFGLTIGGVFGGGRRYKHK